MTRHRFRFFIATPAEVGEEVQLDEHDARHRAVLKLQPGDAIEIVDSLGQLYEASLTAGDRALVAAQVSGPSIEGQVDLYAGLLLGSAWDALLDGATQAGVHSIIGFSASERLRRQHVERAPRAERVVQAAAKQAKRVAVPELSEPTELAEAVPPGRIVVVHPSAGFSLVHLAEDLVGPEPVSVVVGPAEGLLPSELAWLVERGATVANLGPTILRSELAAAVAVSILVQASGSHQVRSEG